jgi:hypothetical protein
VPEASVGLRFSNGQTREAYVTRADSPGLEELKNCLITHVPEVVKTPDTDII